MTFFCKSLIRKQGLSSLNEMAQKCIALLESNENMDSYTWVHTAEKYSRLCGDKEKFEFYKYQRAKLIDERTGFSFIEF